MAIGYLDQYGLQGGTTALTMVPPVGTASGQQGIIFIADKNSSVDPTDPGSGWTRIGSAQVGTGADGVGTGQIRLTAWYKNFAAAEGNTAFTITGANRAIGGGMVYTKGAGETWGVPTITFGSDTDGSSTAFSALMAANLGVLVGEYLLSVGVYTLDTTFAGRNITIPGVTATVTGINSGRGATGNQIALWTDHALSTAGTQSGASTTTGTSGAATTGGALNIRIGLAAASDGPHYQSSQYAGFF